MKLNVTLTGDKKLLKKFKKLDKVMQYKIPKPAFERGAQPIKSDAESRVSSRTGVLAKSIEIKSKQTKGGIKTDIGTDVYYAKWVEEGHPIVVRTRTGKKLIGHQPAAAFLTPAFDSKRHEALSIIQAYIKKRIIGVAG